MTVNDLIEQLEFLVEQGKGDHNVKIAYQPNYPMAENISNVASDEHGNHDTVYITGTGTNDYAPRWAYEV